MLWICIVLEYIKIYEVWLLFIDNVYGRKYCFNVKYWDYIFFIRIGMNKIMFVYIVWKKIIFLLEKVKIKIIWNFCLKCNIYKVVKNIGIVKCFVLYSIWEDMGFVVKFDI